MPSKTSCSACAKSLLNDYTQYSKAKLALQERCHKNRDKQTGPHPKRSLCNDLRSEYSEVKPLAETIPEFLQTDDMDLDIPPTTLSWVSDGYSSDDEDSSDEDSDLRQIFEGEMDQDTSSSDASSDDDNDKDSDSGLTDNELNPTDSEDSDRESDCLHTSFHLKVFAELKEMYAHCYQTPHQRLPKPDQSFLAYVLGMLKYT